MMQKPRVAFQLIVEPIFLRREADEHTSRLSIAGDDDLVAVRFAQKPLV
jgi:hypothetical protein